jgi:catechol 2,3-dioxygenase-like lactoylglutathione lyase family enzyme
MDFKLEAMILPVSDVDRAKSFYEMLGWRQDADFAGADFRVLQFTPPGSECSIIFGKGVTAVAPGSAQGMTLVVKDIEGARTELTGRGIDAGEVYHLFPGEPRGPGRDPKGRSYASFVDFSDPDGNKWRVQEITQRLPGR